MGLLGHFKLHIFGSHTCSWYYSSPGWRFLNVFVSEHLGTETHFSSQTFTCRKQAPTWGWGAGCEQRREEESLLLPAVRAPQQLAQLNPNNPSRLSILLLLLLSQKDTQPCAHEVTEQRLQRSGCPLPPFFPAHQGWPTLSGKWPDKNVLGFLSLLQRLSPAIVMRTNTDYMEMNEPG